MFGRRGFIGMVGAALGFEVAGKAVVAIQPLASLAPHNPWDDPWAEILPYVTPIFRDYSQASRDHLSMVDCAAVTLYSPHASNR